MYRLIHLVSEIVLTFSIFLTEFENIISISVLYIFLCSCNDKGILELCLQTMTIFVAVMITTPLYLKTMIG